MSEVIPEPMSWIDTIAGLIVFGSIGYALWWFTREWMRREDNKKNPPPKP